MAWDPSCRILLFDLEQAEPAAAQGDESVPADVGKRFIIGQDGDAASLQHQLLADEVSDLRRP